MKRIDIIPEEAVDGDSQSNGEIEAQVKRVTGMARTIKIGLEKRLEAEIPEDHPIITWLFRHAASVLNKFSKGKDGLTAHFRLKGRKYDKTSVEFG